MSKSKIDQVADVLRGVGTVDSEVGEVTFSKHEYLNEKSSGSVLFSAEHDISFDSVSGHICEDEKGAVIAYLDSCESEYRGSGDVNNSAIIKEPITRKSVLKAVVNDLIDDFNDDWLL